MNKFHETIGAPPLSVFDTRQNYWRKQKKFWQDKGIDDVQGRDNNLLMSSGNTSLFDPVLTQLMYQWFCPSQGVILDPFAGGVTRGAIASILGFNYYGIDIRPEQIESNYINFETISNSSVPPHWIAGDSYFLERYNIPKVNFIFSCPPYYNLEIYSKDPCDLSNQNTYQDFLQRYSVIIKKSISLLNDNSFACFIVGDFRGVDGFYYNFPLDTVNIFKINGLKLYNEGILLSMIGKTYLRAGEAFHKTRKLAKVHQNVLIFCKGSPILATESIKLSHSIK